MKEIRAIALGVLMAVSLLALAQDASKTGASNTSGKNADLEKVLAAANEQWLCAGPYYKAKAQDCVVCLAKTRTPTK